MPVKKSDVVRQMASLPGLPLSSPGRADTPGYVLGNNQDNAGRALEWFASTMLPGASYDEIETLAATSPAGAGGVVFTPWLTGERSPVDDKHARAGFHNVSLTTTRADLTRAVLEGVAFNLRWLLEGAEHVTRTRLDPLRVLGGAARMDLWCQIVADVLDRTLERVDQPLVGGLRGAGLYAGLALGDVRPDELHELVPVDRVFTPDPAAPRDVRPPRRRAAAALPPTEADVRPPQRLISGRLVGSAPMHYGHGMATGHAQRLTDPCDRGHSRPQQSGSALTPSTEDPPMPDTSRRPRLDTAQGGPHRDRQRCLSRSQSRTGRLR